MRHIKKIPKAIVLIIALLFTISLDFFMYSFLSACPACASFSNFISTQSAVSAPFIASLTALFSLTLKRK